MTGGGPAPVERWVRSATVLFRRVPDGVIVLADRATGPELVSGPGGDLWDLLAVPTTVDELVAELAERYQGDPAVVAVDVATTLAGLAERGMVGVAR